MKERMKLMFAYDGSDGANAALEHLRGGGFPPEGELLIAVVTDISKTVIPDVFELRALKPLVNSRLFGASVIYAKNRKIEGCKQARRLAKHAETRIREILPQWRVTHRPLVGDPVEELLQAAREWQPELILAGSRGRSAVSRFLLGSVSEQLALRSAFSLRIARPAEKSGAGKRLVIGVNNSAAVERVVETVCRRRWTAAAKARLISVDDGVAAGRVSHVFPYAAEMFEWAEERLRAAGLEVSISIKSGDVKTVLLDEARAWKAGAVFIPARGLSGAKTKAALDDAAYALATQAGCTVEIVR